MVEVGAADEALATVVVLSDETEDKDIEKYLDVALAKVMLIQEQALL